jgi:Holliday junction resolvase RusA-like endonuclease
MFTRSFTVEGIPVAKGRARARRIGNFVSMYSPKTTLDFEKKVAEAARYFMGPEKPLETPIRMTLSFHMPIPQSFSKKRVLACLTGLEKYTKKPDVDNLAKAIMDSLNNIVYKDDAQIYSLSIVKLYSSVPFVGVNVAEFVP